MTTNSPPTTPAPTSAEPVVADWPPYPEYGTTDDAIARMKLLEWIWQQVAEGNVQVKPGDHIIATGGRIVGVGSDPDEVFRRIIEAEPELRKARLVAYDIPPREY